VMSLHDQPGAPTRGLFTGCRAKGSSDAVVGVSPLFFGATTRTQQSPTRSELRKIEG
jgi:hypothetical protein